MMKAAVVFGLLCCVAEGKLSDHWEHWGHWGWRKRGPPSKRPTKQDFAKKTPYWSSKANANYEKEGPVDEGVAGLTCEAVHIEHVNRHGSRYDDNDDFTDLLELLAEKGSAIQNPKYAFIKNWQNPFPLNVEKQLNQHGKEELYNMGHRYIHKYGRSAMAEPYNPIYYPIQHTWKARTSRSASAFALSAFQEGRGQLGRDDNEPVAMFSVFSGDEDKDGDKVLLFGDNCPNYDAVVKDDDNAPAVVQEKAYEAKIEAVMGPKVAAKLQLDASIWELEYDGLELLYKACMFETIILDTHPSQSPCAVFDDDDYEMWAFLKDLSEYYESAYGTELAQKIACPLLSKMMKGVKSYSEDSNDAQASFMYGHSDTIMPLLSQLGLYVDPVPLTADMPWDQMMARKWRTGNICPMSANVAMVLHKCTDGDSVTYKTELRHNERRVRWPKCGTQTNVHFCSPQDLMTAYPMAENCEYDTFCQIP